jgi:hypothetical protein
VLYAHTRQTIIGAAGNIILTPANQLMVMGLKIMVAVQLGFQTCDLAITGPTR